MSKNNPLFRRNRTSLCDHDISKNGKLGVNMFVGLRAQSTQKTKQKFRQF